MTSANSHSKQFRAGSLRRKVAKQQAENKAFEVETELLVRKLEVEKRRRNQAKNA